MKEEWIGHGFGILIFMVLVAIFASVLNAHYHPSPQAVLMPSLMIAGAGCILVARLPLYRQGKFWVLGPQALPRESRKWYWVGYSLFAIGALWTLLFIALTKRMIQHAGGG